MELDTFYFWGCVFRFLNQHSPQLFVMSVSLHLQNSASLVKILSNHQLLVKCLQGDQFDPKVEATWSPPELPVYR